MNAKLKELVNNADDGLSDALTIKPGTLEAILKELEKMCISSDSILCEPVAGGPGFKIKLRNAVGDGTLFYIVQNGVLMAGYIPYTDEPDAPGL